VWLDGGRLPAKLAMCNINFHHNNDIIHGKQVDIRDL
jgi:hypothetical protein